MARKYIFKKKISATVQIHDWIGHVPAANVAGYLVEHRIFRFKNQGTVSYDSMGIVRLYKTMPRPVMWPEMSVESGGWNIALVGPSLPFFSWSLEKWPTTAKWCVAEFFVLYIDIQPPGHDLKWIGSGNGLWAYTYSQWWSRHITSYFFFKIIQRGLVGPTL